MKIVFEDRLRFEISKVVTVMLCFLIHSFEIFIGYGTDASCMSEPIRIFQRTAKVVTIGWPGSMNEPIPLHHSPCSLHTTADSAWLTLRRLRIASVLSLRSDQKMKVCTSLMLKQAEHGLLLQGI